MLTYDQLRCHTLCSIENVKLSFTKLLTLMYITLFLLCLDFRMDWGVFKCY